MDLKIVAKIIKVKGYNTKIALEILYKKKYKKKTSMSKLVAE